MKCLLSLAFFICFYSSYSQVKFENVSLNEAFEKASASGKLVFAQLEAEACDECNDVADKAFGNPALGDIVAQKCIAIKIDMRSKDRAAFLRKFPTVGSMGSYFILGSGELLHTYAGTTTFPTTYINAINTAYSKWQEGMVTMNELEGEWSNNPGDVYAMEKYLDKRRLLNLPTDSLLDVYVKRLPPDSFESKRVLVYLASHAPVVGSSADYFLHKNADGFNMAWYSLSLPQRININRRIIGKSLQKAIDSKDEGFLSKIAAFQASTYDNRRSEEASRYNDYLYLAYYLGIKDYPRYLKSVIPYFENYFMSHSVSSVRDQDSANIKSLVKNVKGDTIKTANGMTIKKVSPPYAPQVQYYSRELNNGAWIVYTYSNDKALLDKALKWSEKANEFYQTSASMDTYARLLYKTGKPTEAIEWETKTIEQQKVRGFSYKRFEEVLDKMNKGATKIED